MLSLAPRVLFRSHCCLPRRLVDSVFQQCYKPNMRLLEGQGEELQAVRKASNKHAAFVLHIRWAGWRQRWLQAAGLRCSSPA